MQWKQMRQMSKMRDQQWKMQRNLSKMRDRQWRTQHNLSRMRDRQWRMQHNLSRMRDRQWRTQHNLSRMRDQQWRTQHNLSRMRDQQWRHQQTISKIQNQRWKLNARMATRARDWDRFALTVSKSVYSGISSARPNIASYGREVNVVWRAFRSTSRIVGVRARNFVTRSTIGRSYNQARDLWKFGRAYGTWAARTISPRIPSGTYSYRQRTSGGGIIRNY